MPFDFGFTSVTSLLLNIWKKEKKRNTDARLLYPFLDNWVFFFLVVLGPFVQIGDHGVLTRIPVQLWWLCHSIHIDGLISFWYVIFIGYNFYVCFFNLLLMFYLKNDCSGTFSNRVAYLSSGFTFYCKPSAALATIGGFVFFIRQNDNQRAIRKGI